MPKRIAVGDTHLLPPSDSVPDSDDAVAGADSNAQKVQRSKNSKAKQAQTIPSPAAQQRFRRTSVDLVGRRSSFSKKQKVKAGIEGQQRTGKDDDTAHETDVHKNKRKHAKIEERETDGDSYLAESTTKRKRETKAEKKAKLVEMPLAARTVGQKLNIGAHVSAAGGQFSSFNLTILYLLKSMSIGVHQSVLNSVHIGANAFALFLKSQRKWANPPLQDEHVATFHQFCKDHQYDQAQHVVPHGSYLVNLAHTDKTRTEQAYDSFVDDLKRAEKLGIRLYNFHPGNDQCGNRQAAIAHLASNINRAHSETDTVITLLENMAAGGNVLGTTFEDLRDIITLIINKDRIGVCIDTCHAFAAGYDLRTPEAFQDTMNEFDKIVGFKYLRAMHLNDSKAPFASHRDLHANIGTGFLGLRAFHSVVNERRFAGLPLVLETPLEVRDSKGELVKDEKGKQKEDKDIWAREIKLLESLVGMDAGSEQFRALEAQLQEQGASERERLMVQAERKRAKEVKKAKSPKKRGRKATRDEVKSAKESSPSELGDNSDSEKIGI